MTALLLVVVALAMMLLVRARPAPDPFDPRSGAAGGTRGLVLLLQQQGASVDIVDAAPQAGTDRRVLVLEDRLSDGQRRSLLDFADAGGLVVMADPASSLVGPPDMVTTIAGPTPGSRDLAARIDLPLAECDIGALAHLRGVIVRTGVLFARTGATGHCLGENGGSFVVVHRQGAGIVVQLGDNELFTNGLLRYADNGPLATALLAPTDGARVSILVGDGAAPASASIGGDGDTTLSDLVRPGVWMAIAQLAIAFVVFAAARAIRPGRPVREPDQVPIAGSELVVATGMLMQRARHASRAGSLLRHDAHRRLCEQFHLPANTSVSALDAVVAERTAVPAGSVTAVLERDVLDAEGLLQLSNDLHSVRSRSGYEGANQ